MCDGAYLVRRPRRIKGNRGSKFPGPGFGRRDMCIISEITDMCWIPTSGIFAITVHVLTPLHTEYMHLKLSVPHHEHELLSGQQTRCTLYSCRRFALSSLHAFAIYAQNFVISMSCACAIHRSERKEPNVPRHTFPCSPSQPIRTLMRMWSTQT